MSHCSSCGQTFEGDRCPRCARSPKARRKETLVQGTPEGRSAIIPDEVLAQADDEEVAPRVSRASRATQTPGDASAARRKSRTMVGGHDAPDPDRGHASRGSAARRKRNAGGTVILSDPDDEIAAAGEHDGFSPASSHGGQRGRYDLARSLERADDARPSRLSRLSQLRVTLAGEHSGRTTIMELSGIAESVVAGTDRRLPKSIGRQLLISTIAGVVLIALAIAGLLLGAYRWVLLPALFVPIFALVVYGTLKALPRLASRVGDRVLPGGVPVWVTGGMVFMMAVAALLTWGTSEATARVAVAMFPELAPPELRERQKDDDTEMRRMHADANMKRGKEVRVRPGVLYVPTEFSSKDGAFDLLLHFHGYPPLVEDSIEEAGLNALVHITNLGLGGRPYKARFAVPGAFDTLIADIEKEAASLGLTDARVRRVAIATWSAGYGALFQILKDPQRETPIDAVLAMDGLHGSFVGGGRDVQLESVQPYIDFGREAVANQRLFIITHSAITTAEYPSSTESAEAILAPLGIARKQVDPTYSPPPVTFATAVTAFPADGKKWLTAVNEAHEGDLHVYAYTGNTPEDHIAHLAQMSVTVLPPLKQRWQ